jgi:hypothetical protein
MTLYPSLSRALSLFTLALCIQACSGGGSDHGSSEDPVGADDASVPCAGRDCDAGADAAALDDAEIHEADAASEGDAARPTDDAATGHDGAAPTDDAARPEQDAATASGDGGVPDDDAATGSDDAAVQDGDAGTVEGDAAAPSCTDGAVENEPCGLNARGTRARSCSGGQWSEWSACEDPDECTDGTNDVVSCGSDGSGRQARTCRAGRWESTPCACPEALVMSCAQRCVARQPRVFVRPSVEGCQDGLSWSTASTSIASALTVVADGGEVSIGGGTYTLLATDGLTVVRPVALRGGYAGAGEDPDDRDWVKYPSELTRAPASPPSVSVRPLLTFALSDGHAAQVEGLVFRGGHSAQSSGAIAVSRGDLTVRNSVFHDNSGDQGGAIAGPGPGDALHLFDSVFTNNRAHGGGGALAHATSVRGCHFADNQAGELGGAVLFAELLSESTFEGNVATRGGAAALVDRVEGSHFADNQASEAGGALYTVDRPLLVRGSDFVGNVAGEAGAIGSEGADSALRLLNSTLVENVATGLFGGALAVRHGSLTVVNGLFADNRVMGRESFGTGGAVFFSSEAQARLTHCTFATNSAPREGGALTVTAEWENGKPPPRLHVQIANSLFVDNQAASYAHIYDQYRESEVSGTSLSGQSWTGPGSHNISARAELDETFHALESSPTIDAARAQLLPADTFDLDEDGDASEPLPVDLDHRARSERAPDMGCYERP